MTSKSRELSRRERQIMDIIYARGETTAAEVAAALPDALSDSAVRTFLRILEEKGHLQHREEGPRYVYLPVESHEKASRSALRNVMQTFFKGSLSNAVAALVNDSDKLSREELKRVEKIIKAAKAKRKKDS